MQIKQKLSCALAHVFFSLFALFFVFSLLISFALLLINNKIANRKHFGKERKKQHTTHMNVCNHDWSVWAHKLCVCMSVCIAHKCNFYLRMAPNSWKRIDKSRLYDLLWLFWIELPFLYAMISYRSFSFSSYTTESSKCPHDQ